MIGMGRKSLIAAVLLIPVVLVGFGFAIDQNLERDFVKINRGATEAFVVAALGKPERITGPPDHMAWGSDPVSRNNGECVKELWYRPIVNLFDEAYTVGFDSNGKVVSKYHYISQ